MRLVFLGSPEAATAPLKTLLEQGPAHGHQLIAVVSQPARPIGRKKDPVDPPVAALAKHAGLLTLQPEKASDPTFLSTLADLAPDVAITAAYGQILTPNFLTIPKRATINIHPSLLPRYRGATPVPAALLDGQKISGVTLLFTVQKLDAGAIILQERSPIDEQETAGTLTSRYFALGGAMLFPALEKLQDPAFTGTPQDESQVTHCRKIQKQDGLLDWERSAEDIVHRFRAFEPWPGTFTFHQGRRLALVDLRLSSEGISALAPGEAVLDKRRRCLSVGTGDGAVQVGKLTPAGGKPQTAEAFWNGLKDRSRVIFTSTEA